MHENSDFNHVQWFNDPNTWFHLLCSHNEKCSIPLKLFLSRHTLIAKQIYKQKNIWNVRVELRVIKPQCHFSHSLCFELI